MTVATQKTYMAKAGEITRKCYLIDAKDQILGKIAAKTASILRGKHKAIYTPHVDTGDMVIVINAEKVRVSGNKLAQKSYQRYSGYPSGQRTMKLAVMLQKAPEMVIELAVNRMIPKGPLGNKVKTKLKVYAGDQHPHASQKPEEIKL